MKKVLTIMLFVFLIPMNCLSKEFNFEKECIIYFGDSITQGVGNNNVSWDYYINKENPFKISKNVGVSGATFSNVRKENMIVTQILKEKKKHYDYVIVQGGINDAMEEVPLGKMTHSYQLSSFNQSTFIGAIDTTFYFLKKYYAESTIGIMINYKTPDATSHGWWGYTSDADEYFKALKLLCKKWGYSYIDFYADKKLSKVIGKNELPDGLHLNEEGYRKVATCLLEYISDLQQQRFVLEQEEKKEEERKRFLINYYQEEDHQTIHYFYFDKNNEY